MASEVEGEVEDSVQMQRLEEIRNRDVTKLAKDYMERCTHIQLKCGNIVLLYLNPISTLFSALIIWAFVIYCIVEPTEGKDSLGLAQSWVTEVWTWLYVGTQVRDCNRLSKELCLHAFFYKKHFQASEVSVFLKILPISRPKCFLDVS